MRKCTHCGQPATGLLAGGYHTYGGLTDVEPCCAECAAGMEQEPSGTMGWGSRLIVFLPGCPLHLSPDQAYAWWTQEEADFQQTLLEESWMNQIERLERAGSFWWEGVEWMAWWDRSGDSLRMVLRNYGDLPDRIVHVRDLMGVDVKVEDR